MDPGNLAEVDTIDSSGDPPLAIEVRDLSFTYADAARPALTDVNLRIQRGEVVLLVGLTAAGKSTLYMALSGLIPHVIRGSMFGEVFVDGLDTADTPLATLSQHVGLVLQDPGLQLFSLSVEDELAFGPENLGVQPDEIRRRVDEAVRVVSLEEILSLEPGKLSGGQQQAVAVAAMWTMLPEILILDEPTSNLDPVGSRRVLSLVRELGQRWGKTLLVAEHKIDVVAPFADRVIVMHGGSIVRDGPPGEVFADASLHADYGLEAPVAAQVGHLLDGHGGSGTALPMTVAEAAALLDACLARS